MVALESITVDNLRVVQVCVAPVRSHRHLDHEDERTSVTLV